MKYYHKYLLENSGRSAIAQIAYDGTPLQQENENQKNSIVFTRCLQKTKLYEPNKLNIPERVQKWKTSIVLTSYLQKTKQRQWNEQNLNLIRLHYLQHNGNQECKSSVTYLGLDSGGRSSIARWD